VEVENQTSSLTRKTWLNKSWLDSTTGANQFQVLRELLGDYRSSDCNSVGGDLVIPESAFEGVVGDRTQRSPCVTKKDCIIYSRRREKGKGKVINEVRSCSSSMLGCGGVNADVDFSVGQAQGDELNGLAPPHCHLLLGKFLVGYWTVLSFSVKGWDCLLKAKKWSCCLSWPH